MPNLRSVNLWGQTVLAAVVALVLGMLLGGALQRFVHEPVAEKGNARAENSSLFDVSAADEVELGVGRQEEAELVDATEGTATGASSATSAAVGDYKQLSQD